MHSCSGLLMQFCSGVDTVICWHRAGFKAYWRWRSRPRRGRPTVPVEIRQLIREMSLANPLWGAPRIHGELLKLGIDIGQTSVAKYMARRRGPPSHGWRTFLHNHADGIAAIWPREPRPRSLRRAQGWSPRLRTQGSPSLGRTGRPRGSERRGCHALHFSRRIALAKPRKERLAPSSSHP